MDKRESGFTLIELIIALVILGVVAVGVVPTVSDIMTRNRSSSITNEFLGALNYARSEAVTRTRSTTMCRIDSTAGSCTHANVGAGKCVCATTNTSEAADGWEDGWLTFVDIDGDAVVETADGDELLQVQAPLGGGFTIRGNSDATDNISFGSNGTTEGISAATIAVCAPGTDFSEGSSRMATARGITLIATGRARATAFTDADASKCNL